MTMKNLILEDIEGDLFDSAMPAETVLTRKISLARVLAQAKKAFNVAESSGNEALAKKLQERIDTLQELLDRADEVPPSRHDSKEKAPETSDSSADEEGSEESESPDTDTEGKGTDGENNDDVPEETGDTEEDTADSSDPESGSDEGTSDETDTEDLEDDTDGAESKSSGTSENENADEDDSSNAKTGSDGSDSNDENEGGEETDGEETDSDSTSGKSSGSDETETDDGGASSSSDGDDGDADNEDESESEGSAPKVNDDTILINPFDNSMGNAKLPKELADMLNNGDLKQESVFEAAKRILGKLSGEARRGAVQGIKDLLAKNGVKVEESYKPNLLEKLSKTLQQMSDDEFNDELSTTMELVDQVLKIDYSDDLDARVAEIKKDASSRISRMELDKEDAEHIRAERDALKAFERENDKYTGIRGLKGLEAFKNSLYNAVSDQVERAEDEVDSWAALDRRHEDDPTIIKKGTLIDDGDEEIPSVYVYFDQSGSWSDREIEIGKRAISVINEFHENGEINLKIFYISAGGVFTEASAARPHGGAEGWHATLQHIKSSKAKNVVILSDDDLDYFEWSNRPTGDNGRTIVDGCVWWLWKNSNVSKKALKELVGRSGTFQYQFTTSGY